MDKMVAPSPLVFNFRVCVWLGIGNQEALSVSPPHPPASGLGLTLGGRPSFALLSLGPLWFPGRCWLSKLLWQGGVPIVGSAWVSSECLPSLDGPTHQVQALSPLGVWPGQQGWALFLWKLPAPLPGGYREAGSCAL